MVSAYRTEVKNIHQFTLKLAHINRLVNQVATSAETPDPTCVLTTRSDITGLCDAFPWNYPTLSIFSLRHRHPDCLLLSRVDCNIRTTVIYTIFCT